jgi:hypothetical protein
LVSFLSMPSLDSEVMREPMRFMFRKPDAIYLFTLIITLRNHKGE